MRFSLSQYALRVTCGLGLLLLPAVQQKLCTRPAATRSVTRQPAKSTSSPGSKKTNKHNTRAPLTLAAMVPDVAPPRWPNHTHLCELQRVRPLPVSTWTPGGDSPGDSPDGPTATFVPLGADGHILAASILSAAIADELIWPTRRGLLLFRTSIQRTGPPHA